MSLVSYQTFARWVRDKEQLTAQTKGKVERGIDYAQENALKRRTFSDLSEQNDFLLRWETSVADTRIHGTTRKQVGKLFTESERQALQPVPLERFPLFHEAQRTVHRDGHVSVENAYYSVPPEYVTRRVWVRWDSRLVRIFDHKMQQIALHTKHEPGRFSTQSNPHCFGENRPRGARRRVAALADGVGRHYARLYNAAPEMQSRRVVKILSEGISSQQRKVKGEIDAGRRFQHEALRPHISGAGQRRLWT